MMRNIFTTLPFFALALSLNAQINSGLVAQYEFNNTIPDTFDGTREIYPEAIMDKHTWYVHDGVTPTTDRNGNANMAADFDGMDDDLLYVDNELINVVDDLTLNYWVYLDNYPSSQDMLAYTITNRHDQNGAEQPGIDMSVNNDGQFTMVLRGANASGLVNIPSVDSLALNTWYNITVTKQDSVMELFIDCVSQGTDTIANYMTNILLFPNPDFWSFGGMYNDDGSGMNMVEVVRKLDGRLDNVYFYNRVLTPTELDTLCNDLGMMTNVNDIEEEPSIRLYPNPAQQQINLELGDNYGAAIASIYNAHGQLVVEEQVANAYSTIAIDQLKAGMYWIVVRNETGKQTTLSFVKE